MRQKGARGLQGYRVPGSRRFRLRRFACELGSTEPWAIAAYIYSATVDHRFRGSCLNRTWGHRVRVRFRVLPTSLGQAGPIPSPGLGPNAWLPINGQMLRWRMQAGEQINNPRTLSFRRSTTTCWPQVLLLEQYTLCTQAACSAAHPCQMPRLPK